MLKKKIYRDTTWSCGITKTALFLWSASTGSLSYDPLDPIQSLSSPAGGKVLLTVRTHTNTHRHTHSYILECARMHMLTHAQERNS